MENWNPNSTLQIELVSGDLHLWRFRLDGIGTADQDLWNDLSPQEQERAARFHFDLHRQRFLRTHAFCRRVLSRYCYKPAAQLEFQTRPEGKPYLVQSRGPDIRYNLSHSGDLMVMAVTLDAEVGVDVEVHSEALDWNQIAASYFDTSEIGALSKIQDRGLQQAYFYRIWTMKEAYLKARGQGIAVGLRHTIVNMSGDRLPSTFAELPGGEDEIRRWQVYFFQPATGASGTVVIELEWAPYRVIQFDGSISAQGPN